MRSTTKWICKINCRGGGTANQTVTEEWIIKTFSFNHRPFWIICWLRQKYHLPLLSLRSIRGQNPIFDLVVKYFKMYSGTIFYQKITIAYLQYDQWSNFVKENNHYFWAKWNYLIKSVLKTLTFIPQVTSHADWTSTTARKYKSISKI